MVQAEPSPSNSKGSLNEGNQSFGQICPKALSGRGSGRGISGGRSSVTSESLPMVPPRQKQSLLVRLYMPTVIPFRSTILAWTTPLARKAVPDGLIFISLMVTFRRSRARGFGAGNLVSIQTCGKRGVETVTVLTSLER